MDNESKDNRMSLIRFFQNQSRRLPDMVDFNLIRSINSFSPPPPFPRLFQYQFAWIDRGYTKFTGDRLYQYLYDIFRGSSPIYFNSYESGHKPVGLNRVFKNLKDLNSGVKERVFINEYDEVPVRNFTSIYIHPQMLTEEWKQNLIILEQLLLDLLEKNPDFTIDCMRDYMEDYMIDVMEDLSEEDVWLRDTVDLVMSTEELTFGYALYLVKKLFEKCIDSVEKIKRKLLIGEWRDNEFEYGEQE